MIDHPLEWFYSTFYFLKKEGNFSLYELDDLVPFELDIYEALAMKELKEKLQAAKNANK